MNLRRMFPSQRVFRLHHTAHALLYEMQEATHALCEAARGATLAALEADEDARHFEVLGAIAQATAAVVSATGELRPATECAADRGCLFDQHPCLSQPQPEPQQEAQPDPLN